MLRQISCKLFIAVCAGVLFLALGTGQAAAQPDTPVDLELSILVDVSGSVVTSEFELQRDAYANAFNNPALHALINAGPKGSIAANFVYWSSEDEQQESVAWTQMSSAADAIAFGNAIGATTRPFSGLTSISGALQFASPLFNSNGFVGDRMVIDVSGDGTNNDDPTGTNLATERAAALAIVDTINGIVIESAAFNTVLNHYQSSVIGGPNAFVLKANDFESFEPAILDKLRFEISGDDPNVIPEPSTFVLSGLGLVGLGLLVWRRRRRSG